MNMQDLPYSDEVAPLAAALLPQARLLANQTGRPLIEVLEELSGLTPDLFVRALGHCMHYPTMTTLDLHAMQPLFDLLRFNDASAMHVLLMQKADQSLQLVIADPFDEPLQMRLQSLLRQPVQWCLAHRNDIAACLQFHEAQMRALDQVHASDSLTQDEEETPVEQLSLKSISEDSSPVVRFVRSTLYDALKAGASDIHLESTLHGLHVKYRIDGVLTEVGGLSGVMQAEQAISRIKVMSELDIAERRIPQDGRCKVHALGRDIDLRVSIMPSVVGEDAVLRVLDRKALSEAQGISLEVLGFAPALLAQIRTQAEAPYGMLLVTGPTGSGKTTTLYGMISEINQGQDKIITIEDPVEYQLPGVLQIPVNEKKGLTFARGLRSILRHDPDKIMVGEIRDGETAQIAVQSALTGHLVLTTVHANNVFDVISRFTNMGVDAYSFVSAVNVILAQRLVRVICPFCKVDDVPEPALLAKSGLTAQSTQHYQFKKGQGCGQCHGSGYKGRKGIAELLLFDDRMRELIVSKAPISQIKALAATTGTRAMRESGLALVAAGETTLQEINRVTSLS
ncbi:GspE/PulE family protein [Methylophilus medardicus]|uniref:Type II/IV secretion system protein n=1 Tax=Methylophilus medardicus TaxID=2588534 RepID=A0A5B8CQV1_9PROT|nr:GspE/PulE family protein [Methylophilus medardicus]QDC43569.1 type II/IV secretion system protein [Methylophilus medardicus]QDC48576.1 type II/IV secretion system protein [Methylophilus medardicus]QDC52281.1 type II/IV secretion system protein [Methylophilus medardicus]